MKTLTFLTLTASLFFICNNGFAQDFSNKGKDFWVIYTGHVDGTVSRMALYITSDQNATGKVDVNGSTIPFTVTANNVTTIQFTNTSNPSNSVVYNGQIEGIGAKKESTLLPTNPLLFILIFLILPAQALPLFCLPLS